MKIRWSAVVIAITTILFILLRFFAYEPIGASIATYDTPGFMASAHIPFPSARFFLSNRPATISLVYKLFEPGSGYQLTAFSSPAEDIFAPPAVQPGLDRIAIFQSLLSTGAWLLLALIIVRRLRHPVIRILATIFILAFGLSPTIVEWDAILLSEPLSLSLFVILIAISIELVARIAQSFQSKNPWTDFLIVVWVFVLILWLFARDTNAYLLLVLVGAVAVLTIARWKSRVVSFLSLRAMIIVLSSLVLLFFVHNFTFRKSNRWINPFFNNVIHNVFPFPEHVDFFENRGFPITEEVWALRTSPGNEDRFFEIPEVMTWTTEHGTRTYMQFLLAYPAWTLEKFFSGIDTSFSENRQPFFFPNEERTMPVLSYIGDLLHPNSSSVIWVVLAELAIFGYLAIILKQAQALSLFLLSATFFFGEILMLFVSIHGDALGIVRHGMGSVMPLRLSIWLLALFILDLCSMQIELSDKKLKTQKESKGS